MEEGIYMKKPDFLLNRLQKYSIRKFTVGTASILIGSLVFLGADAQAAEGQDRENFVSAELSSIENDATDSDLELKDNTQELKIDNDETESNEANLDTPHIYSDDQDVTKDNAETTNNLYDNETKNKETNRNEEKLFKVKETKEVEKAEAKDISNDIEVEAKLEIKDKVNAVPKAEHGYDIKSEYDIDMVVDVESDIDKAKFDFEAKIPPTAKEGDYFDVKYTRELTISPYDKNAVTNGRNPHTGVQNGVYDPETKELIATVKDIKEENIIRYTLTNYVERIGIQLLNSRMNMHMIIRQY